MRRAWARVVVAVGVSALAACGGSSTPSTTVTGTLLDTYWKDDGSVVDALSTDPAQTSVSALVRDGAGYHEVPGTIATNGTFTIPDVGTGSYLLRVVQPYDMPRYYAESARRIDLGRDVVGRPTRTIATLSTPATFSLTDLEPWATGDGLELYSTGARLVAPIPSAAITGATSGDFTLDFLNHPLPEAGDLGWVLQSEQRQLGPRAVPCFAVVRSAPVATRASLPDGGSVTVPLRLSPPPQGTVALDVRRSQFAALLPAVAPAGTATLDAFDVSLGAVPRVFVYFDNRSLFAWLLSARLPAGTDDVDLGTVPYSRPFPAWFTEFRAVEWMITVEIPAALGAPSETITPVARRIERLAGASSVIAPTLGPARQPRIAGLDALQPQAGVGLTPTLSWSGPAIGAASYYSIWVSELGAGDPRAYLAVTGTSVDLPPSILEPGKVYFATIWAISEPGWKAAAPNRYSAPRESVPFFTAPFSP